MKLHPYKQVSIANKSNAKLAYKLFGQFLVLEKIQEVAYKMQLPPQLRIHNIFHVSQLKRHVGESIISSTLSTSDEDLILVKDPEMILDMMTKKKKR